MVNRLPLNLVAFTQHLSKIRNIYLKDGQLFSSKLNGLLGVLFDKIV